IYTRNRIRLSLMPLLDRDFPNWRRTLSSLGDRVAEEHDCLLRQARQLADQQMSMKDNGLCLNRDAFLEAEPALRNLMLQEAMLHLGAPAGRLWRLAKVLDKAIVAGEENINLPGVAMRRDGQAIMLSGSRSNLRPGRMTRLDFLQEDRYFLILRQEGEYHAPGFTFVLASGDPGEHTLTTLQGFLPLVVRNRQAGDFVITATGRKMVDDYLKECGIPQVIRNVIPVVEDRHGICAVLPAALECCSGIRPLLRDPVYGGELFLLRIYMKGAEISHGKP
ncbi:MAG: tRNA lysidine(34) synthetase TilS, partial [Spirochaetales bacterium]|nr:tRNA lysidine(34) synthetase TilS [Spirochaetales bacterium]